jgi:hypothetical protein
VLSFRSNSHWYRRDGEIPKMLFSFTTRPGCGRSVSNDLI